MKLEWLKQSHNMVDIIHGVIPYDGLEAKIIDSPTFARLQRVMQSSLAYMNYPSNKVHRYEHSIGVMHLAGLFFFHSISNSEDNDVKHFFEEVSSKLEKWIEGDNAKNYLKENVLSDVKKKKDIFIKPNQQKNLLYLDNKLFREYTPSNLSNNQLTLYYIVYEAVRLSGLLHDIGHLPYSHITEFALKRLYDQVESNHSEDNAKLSDFLSIMQPYCNKNNHRQIHEEVGQKLVNKIFHSIAENFPKSSAKEDFFLAAVFHLTECILVSGPQDDDIASDLHRIVDGVIDCDRMDYCCRDLYCAGISKELPRYERLFYTVKLFYNTPQMDDLSKGKSVRERCNFSFNSKALSQIEMLLLRRWEDFTTINYHHNVHKHELLLESAITLLGKEYLFNDQEDTYQEGLLPFTISSIWRVIKETSENGAVEILCSQLDDEWLNTLLKYQFYNCYGDSYQSRFDNHNDVKWNILDELITGQKHYCSLFKRNGGFGRFDKDFLHAYKEIVGDDIKFVYDTKKDDEYFFSVLLRNLNKKATVSSAEYFSSVEKKLREYAASDLAQKNNIIDCIVDENDFSLGIKASDMESIYIISSREGKPHAPLKSRSSIFGNLEMQKRLFPPFHVYYLPKYDINHDEYMDVNSDLIQAEVATIMAQAMYDMLQKKNAL